MAILINSWISSEYTAPESIVPGHAIRPASCPDPRVEACSRRPYDATELHIVAMYVSISSLKTTQLCPIKRAHYLLSAAEPTPFSGL